MIFSGGRLLQPVALPASRLAGDYALFDDGWRCSLSLRETADGGLVSRFRSYDRNEGEFVSSITVGGEAPNRVTLVVHDFNELDRGIYVAYASCAGPVYITGSGDWKGTPFGYFAARCPPFRSGPDIPGELLPAAFLGRYTVHCEGRRAALHLAQADGTLVRGELHEAGGTTYPVSGEVDAVVRHRVSLTVADVPDGPATLSLLMFVRSRAALAGWLDWSGQRYACYLTRFGGPDSHEELP
jgi:hypothetical protein